MKNLLLVEDDPHITNLLNLHFHDPHYKLTCCGSGSAAFEEVTGSPYDLVILDVMLPDINGIDICRRIRTHNEMIPILMLSSLSEETDKVMALESGADDYLTKPFGIFELMARTRALIRRLDRRPDVMEAPAAINISRAAQPLAGIIAFRDLHIDRNKRKVSLGQQRLDMTPKEFDLLCLLAGSPGKTFTRHELLDLVWGFAFQEYEHTVTSHINRLRVKLEKDLNKPEYILTTWGTGYRFAE